MIGLFVFSAVVFAFIAVAVLAAALKDPNRYVAVFGSEQAQTREFQFRLTAIRYAIKHAKRFCCSVNVFDRHESVSVFRYEPIRRRARVKMKTTRKSVFGTNAFRFVRPPKKEDKE